jgi:hypothetical protein
MSAATVHIDDLDPEQRQALGLRKPCETAFSKVDLRGWSLKVLAVMAGLSRVERERVLKHALKVNRV